MQDDALAPPAKLGARSIGDLALLSDCQSAALVGLDGAIEWYCPARFDAQSVFARLLDPAGGHWSIHPAERPARVARDYLEDTMVLRTTFHTPRGVITLTDALALEDGARGHQIGLRARRCLVRRVECVAGEVDVAVVFVPRPNYALSMPQITLVEGEVVASDQRIDLRLIAARPFAVQTGEARAHFTLRHGESADFALLYRERVLAGQAGAATPRIDVGAELRNATEGWRSWAAEHTTYAGPYAERVRRSSLVLQALTYQPTGAVVAAATTSLPEVAGADANWDYRFAWLRDLSFTAQALWVAACSTEATRLFSWVRRALGGAPAGADHVQIVYGVEAERVLDERVLAHLGGFRESRPVRIGNDAYHQKQLDVLGEVNDAIWRFADHLDGLGEPGDGLAPLVAALADRAAASWREPDAGMWEARDRERHYVSSKVMCWVALDRALRLAPRLGGHAEHASSWASARDEIRRTVLAEGWNASAGAYMGAFGSDHLDASVLLLPLVDFLPATDARMRATIDKVERELAPDGLVRRWAGEPNGFLLCTFWLVECLALAGETARATTLFERTAAVANDLGLMAEMVDPRTGELLGNMPQALSHIGFINAAWRLGQMNGDRRDDRDKYSKQEAGGDRRAGDQDVLALGAPPSASTTERTQDMAQRLQGKVALITGSDSGIGQATAIEFAKEGADVVVTYFKDAQGAERTRVQVEALGRRAIVAQVDVSDERQVDALFERALAAFGTVDILVNNGGVDASGTPVADLTTEVWDRAIRTNLYGYFFCCRRFINVRKGTGGGGKIINVTSVHEEIPRAGAAEYDCSKGGERNLTRTLALELAPLKINVNNIGPGMVLTPFNQDAIDDPQVRERQVQSIPWKRAAQPEEIGRLAVFLASSDADYVTGSSYYMDGGLMQNQGQGA